MNLRDMDYFVVLIICFEFLAMAYYGTLCVISIFDSRTTWKKISLNFSGLCFFATTYSFLAFIGLMFEFSDYFKSVILTVAGLVGYLTFFFYIRSLKHYFCIYHEKVFRFIEISASIIAVSTVLITLYTILNPPSPEAPNYNLFLLALAGSYTMPALLKIQIVFHIILIGGSLSYLLWLTQTRFRTDYLIKYGLIVSLLALLSDMTMPLNKYAIPLVPVAYFLESIRIRNEIRKAKVKKNEFLLHHFVEEANESKMKIMFTSIMHDLRTPLRVIQNVAQSSTSQNEVIDRAVRNINEQLAIYKKIFEFEADDKLYALRPLVEKVRQNFRNQLIDENIEFMNDVPTELQMQGSELHIYILMQNLISNSLNAFTKNSQDKLIRINAFPDLEPGFIKISITDSGHGFKSQFNLPEESSALIKEITRSGKGFYIISKIVQEHMGEIHIERYLGHTTISLTLLQKLQG